MPNDLTLTIHRGATQYVLPVAVDDLFDGRLAIAHSLIAAVAGLVRCDRLRSDSAFAAETRQMFDAEVRALLRQFAAMEPDRISEEDKAARVARMMASRMTGEQRRAAATQKKAGREAAAREALRAARSAEMEKARAARAARAEEDAKVVSRFVA
jgi:hypothetical protein